MTRNPILDELRRAREKLLADAGGDLAKLAAEMRERQTKSGHRVVSGRVESFHKTEDHTNAVANTES